MAAGCSSQPAREPAEGSGAAQPIPFPNTQAGSALRVVYTGGPPSAAQVNQLIALTSGAERDKVIKELEPALVAIIRQDDSPRGLYMACLLAGDAAAFQDAAPEFQRLVPAVVRALNAGPADVPIPALRGQWQSMMAALLAQLGPDASYAFSADVGKRFNARAAEVIAPESPESWARFDLAELMVGYGDRAVPVLVEGLRNGDPYVRACAINALKEMHDVADLSNPPARVGWDGAWERIRTARPKLISIVGQITALAGDSDEAVRKAAKALADDLAAE